MTAWPVVDTWSRETRQHLAGWSVDTLCRAGSSADVHRVPGCLHVRVADDLAVDGGPGGTDVLLRPDGQVEVVCRLAPPVLVVAHDGGRLVPQMSGRSGDAQLAPGDLVVVCSSDALDHLPMGIGAVLGWAPREAAAEQLLSRLMEDTDHGAALVARYTPDPRRTDDPQPSLRGRDG